MGSSAALLTSFQKVTYSSLSTDCGLRVHSACVSLSRSQLRSLTRTVLVLPASSSSTPSPEPSTSDTGTSFSTSFSVSSRIGYWMYWL